MGIINSFTGQYFFLSNFYPSSFAWNGQQADTVEHHFNAAKTLNYDERQRVYEAKTPSLAKRAGRRVTLRSGWDDRVRFEIMTNLLFAKFGDADLRQKLFNTQPHILVEGNTWHDQTWGDCTCPQHAHISGHNMLGQMLMTVREELRMQANVSQPLF